MRFYKLDDREKGKIYVQVCDRLKDPRRCQRTYYDLLEEWDYFKGDFILIPFSLVFP